MLCNQEHRKRLTYVHTCTYAYMHSSDRRAAPVQAFTSTQPVLIEEFLVEITDMLSDTRLSLNKITDMLRHTRLSPIKITDMLSHTRLFPIKIKDMFSYNVHKCLDVWPPIPLPSLCMRIRTNTPT